MNTFQALRVFKSTKFLFSYINMNREWRSKILHNMRSRKKALVVLKFLDSFLIYGEGQAIIIRCMIQPLKACKSIPFLKSCKSEKNFGKKVLVTLLNSKSFLMPLLSEKSRTFRIMHHVIWSKMFTISTIFFLPVNSKDAREVARCENLILVQAGQLWRHKYYEIHLWWLQRT